MYRYKFNVFRFPAIDIVVFASAAPFRLKLLFITEIKQRIHISVGNQNDVTASSPIATVRATEFHGFFVQKRNLTRPALAGLDANNYFIDEFMHFYR